MIVLAKYDENAEEQGVALRTTRSVALLEVVQTHTEPDPCRAQPKTMQIAIDCNTILCVL
eukprot:935630-Amphidinium_carterae.2